jgi:hypothetical protein
MQNKPNFRKAKMKLSFYSTKDYENQGRLRTPGKQTQSNPITNPGYQLTGADLEPEAQPDGDVDMKNLAILVHHWLESGCLD